MKTEETSVVRIKAGASAGSKSKKAAKTNPAVTSKGSSVAVTEKPVTAKKPRRKMGGLGIFRAIGGYFKGAWIELRQVRWPNRRATWSLTGAVLAYSAFFVVIVLLLDAGFKYLFELILGK